MFLGLLFLFKPAQLNAIAKFNTTYQVYYEVADSGITHVKFIINQKNNLTVVYATDFGLSINETKLENIRVLDEGVPVKADVIKSLNQTSISFPFSSKVVGKDKIHTFTIEYDTPDITSKSGNTWQIDIPRLENFLSASSVPFFPARMRNVITRLLPLTVSTQSACRSEMPPIFTTVSILFSNQNSWM